MPELPDVAVFKKYMDRTALHQKIDQTRVFDDYVIKDVTKQTVQRRLSGHTFESTRRHGKHLFAEIGNDGGWLELHFGMTGYLRYSGDKEALPDETRLRFDFENGKHLAYACRRKLGQVRIVNDLDQFLDDQKLGPDALDEVDAETFLDRVGQRSGSIKTTLTNQKVLAGLGNIYTDEILFQAGVHPQSDVSDIDEDDLRDLHEKMKEVLTAAIRAKADPEEMPSNFLLPHRTEGNDCPQCGGSIRKIDVGGRSTYLCPKCQKKR